MSPLRFRGGCLYTFAGPKRTRHGGKVLIAGPEWMQHGATADPRSAFVADPSLRSSELRYGSVSRVRSGSRNTAAEVCPFAVWVGFKQPPIRPLALPKENWLIPDSSPGVQTAFLDFHAAPSARRSASSWSGITRSRHQCNDGRASGRRRRKC